VAAIDEVGRDVPAGDGTSFSPERIRAMDATRRLDDGYRQFLGERGAGPVAMPLVTRLLTGCARIRLTAITFEGLPVLAVPGGPHRCRRSWPPAPR